MSESKKTVSKFVNGLLVTEEVKPKIDFANQASVQSALTTEIEPKQEGEVFNLTLEEDYQQQLKEFYEDESYFHLYDNFTPFSAPGTQVGRKVLVKIFKFVPRVKGKIGSTLLYMPSPLNGELKTSVTALNEKVYPIIKVIKKGLGAEYSEFIKVGTLYTVPVDDVVGDDWNPEFTFFMNTMVTQGKTGGHVKIPEGMRQRIPKLERNWDKYKFGLPTRLGDETEEDRLIYLIPDMKLDAILTI